MHNRAQISVAGDKSEGCPLHWGIDEWFAVVLCLVGYFCPHSWLKVLKDKILHINLNENPESTEGETTDSSIGLYVVENGKEYPLIPLKERKSMFESSNQVKSFFFLWLFCFVLWKCI